MRLLIAVSCALSLLVATSAVADPPDAEDVKKAKQLSNQAAKLARKKRWGEAAQLLGEAEGLDPTWTYAFELAKGHEETGGYVAAWRALRRGEGYGVPAKQQGKHDDLLRRVETELMKSYALIELQVVPEGATVKIGGQEWLAPWVDWVQRESTIMQLEHPSCVPLKVMWLHPIGAKSQRTVRLEPQENHGRLVVTGKPAGAKVLVNGELAGLLPNARSKLLKPDEYVVRVEHSPGYLPVETRVRVGAGLENKVEVDLEKTESAAGKLLKSKKFWGWFNAGAGGAAAITGAVLLGLAAGMVADVNELNETHTGSYGEYLERYDELSQGIPGMATAGWVTLGVGVALGATGAILLVLDSQGDEKASGETEGRFVLVPAPAGIGAQVRF